MMMMTMCIWRKLRHNRPQGICTREGLSQPRSKDLTSPEYPGNEVVNMNFLIVVYVKTDTDP